MPTGVSVCSILSRIGHFRRAFATGNVGESSCKAEPMSLINTVSRFLVGPGSNFDERHPDACRHSFQVPFREPAIVSARLATCEMPPRLFVLVVYRHAMVVFPTRSAHHAIASRNAIMTRSVSVVGGVERQERRREVPSPLVEFEFECTDALLPSLTP
jgi:hypothetical protein